VVVEGPTIHCNSHANANHSIRRQAFPDCSTGSNLSGARSASTGSPRSTQCFAFCRSPGCAHDCSGRGQVSQAKEDAEAQGGQDCKGNSSSAAAGCARSPGSGARRCRSGSATAQANAATARDSNYARNGE
jgi:hypothetical protein